MRLQRQQTFRGRDLTFVATCGTCPCSAVNYSQRRAFVQAQIELRARVLEVRADQVAHNVMERPRWSLDDSLTARRCGWFQHALRFALPALARFSCVRHDV